MIQGSVTVTAAMYVSQKSNPINDLILEYIWIIRLVR